MEVQFFHLKDAYPVLGEDRADPILTVYLPYNTVAMNRQNPKRPTVLICPGGGYTFCSEREAEPIALHFLADGYNVLILRYSTDGYRFPTQVREVAAAMELIYAHASEWHCDTDRVVLVGFSAGGHLAAHYCNAYDCPEVREVFPESKPVNACILGYPVITADGPTHKDSFAQISGHAEPTPADIAKFSCEKLVSDHTPPAYIWHTATDDVVPVRSSLLYATALADHHIPFELHIFPFGGHGLATVNHVTLDEPPEPKVAVAAEWIHDALRWLHFIFEQE